MPSCMFLPFHNQASTSTPSNGLHYSYGFAKYWHNTLTISSHSTPACLIFISKMLVPVSHYIYNFSTSLSQSISFFLLSFVPSKGSQRTAHQLSITRSRGQWGKLNRTICTKFKQVLSISKQWLFHCLTSAWALQNSLAPVLILHSKVPHQVHVYASFFYVSHKCLEIMVHLMYGKDTCNKRSWTRVELNSIFLLWHCDLFFSKVNLIYFEGYIFQSYAINYKILDLFHKAQPSNVFSPTVRRNTLTIFHRP